MLVILNNNRAVKPNAGACLRTHISRSVSADAYQWERMFADAYQWARVSADVYQWERCLFSPLSFAAAVIPHFLLRFLEDSA